VKFLSIFFSFIKAMMKQLDVTKKCKICFLLFGVGVFAHETLPFLVKLDVSFFMFLVKCNC